MSALCAQEDYKICGHVGCAGRITGTEELIFKQLLVVDSLRGEDSTGIASVNNKGDVDVVKQVGNPFELLNMKYTDAIFKQQNRVLIGHNRYATTGKVDKYNAHPFDMDTLVGAHNGTLKDRHTLKFNGVYQVDSEQLFANIEVDGEEVALPKTNGAYALVWWDKVNEKLKIIRNNQRTLYYTYSMDKRVIFWASEAWMLEVILHRNTYKHTKIEPFTEDMLYTFNIPTDVLYGQYQELTYSNNKIKREETKVVPFNTKKKNWETSKTTGLDGSLVGSEVCVELGSVCCDHANNKFLQGRVKDDVHTIFRLYCSENMLTFLTKQTVKAKVFGYNQSVGYYLLNPASVDVLEEIEEEVVVLDHNGKEINKTAFEYRYSTCSNCTADIQYGDTYKPLTVNTCLCLECMSEELEVISY